MSSKPKAKPKAKPAATTSRGSTSMTSTEKKIYHAATHSEEMVSERFEIQSHSLVNTLQGGKCRATNSKFFNSEMRTREYESEIERDRREQAGTDPASSTFSSNPLSSLSLYFLLHFRLFPKLSCKKHSQTFQLRRGVMQSMLYQER